MQDLARVREAGTNVVRLERRVAVENLLLGPTRRQKIDHQLNGYSRPLNNRFANKDLWVHGDVVTPVHDFTIAEQGPLGLAFGEIMKGEAPWRSKD